MPISLENQHKSRAAALFFSAAALDVGGYAPI
jgi:hypothetical protein